MSGSEAWAHCPHCGSPLRGQPRVCDQCGREVKPVAGQPSSERTTLTGMRLPPIASPPFPGAETASGQRRAHGWRGLIATGLLLVGGALYGWLR